jgi:uncharacterized protein (TIGR03086 family)
VTNPAIVDDLARASAVMGDLIDRIAAGQWTAPTPCTEWSVRDLVNHLVGMNLVFVAMLEESPMPERRADRLGADPAGAYRRSAAALQAAAARPGVLERSQATPLGVATGQPRAGRFTDPQPIRDDAPAIDRLAAFTGRPVPWTP